MNPYRAFTVFASASFLAVAALESRAESYFASPQGSDANDGLSESRPFKSVQRGVDALKPGDELLLLPGIYYGSARIETSGTAEKPLRVRAARVEKGLVTLSGADKALREGAKSWTLEDDALKLYSVAYDGPPPSRVLYSGIDLYPYSSLDALKSFLPKENGLGPRHGHFYDEAAKKLYVRLHDAGKYGPVDPNKHLMAVGPALGKGFDGTIVSKASDYCIGVPGRREAHVEISGVAFETPGVCGVYVEASDVAVKDCWFTGCHSGVGGSCKQPWEESSDDYFGGPYDKTAVDRAAARTLIEHCEFTQSPAFEDAKEALLLAGEKAKDFRKYFWWARKSSGNGLPSDKYKYEIGIASRIGRDWRVVGNRVYDSFEALSCHATSSSVGLLVEGNLFERLVDNAVEAEDHSEGMRVEGNLMEDVFEPVSWQPISGEPWPGPYFIERNVIFNSAGNAGLWRYAHPERGVFKLGASRSNWNEERNPQMKGSSESLVRIPPPGIVVRGNIVFSPSCRLLNVIGGFKVAYDSIAFEGNAIATDNWVSSSGKVPYEDGKGSIKYAGNVCAPASPASAGPGETVAGNRGRLLKNAEDIGFENPENGCFALRPGSPLSSLKLPSLSKASLEAGPRAAVFQAKD